MTIDVKRAVVDNKRVKFEYYRDGDLWYSTEHGEEFPVPVSDVGTATFKREDKAILFMRYMNKYNSMVEKARHES